MKHSYKDKKGFTLAEVLITLGIIGVVVALVMPNLIANYQKKVTVNRLKTVYSLLANALLSAQAEYGESVSDIDINLSEEEFGEKYLRPFLNPIKVCTKMQDRCWEVYKNQFAYGYYDLKGKPISTPSYSLVLKNGIVVGVNKISNSTNLLSLIVNLDGNSGKNIMGRDVFSFYFFNKEKILEKNPSYAYNLKNINLNSGLYPGGYDLSGPPHVIYSRDDLLSSSVYRSCNKDGRDEGGGGRPGIGTACAAVIAKDGWQIKDDYPW